MSDLLQCCNPCPTVQTVSIPGIEGDPGTPGAPGTDGINGYGILTANMIVPPDTTTPVTITLDDTSWMVEGQIIVIGQGVGSTLTNPGPATFVVDAILSTTSARLLWKDAAIDVAAGTQIDLGAVISSSGTDGASAVYPTTTKGDIMVDDGVNSPLSSVVRQGVGVNGQAILADSALTNGLGYKGVSRTVNVNTTPASYPGAVTTEQNLISFSVPANTLLTNGDSLEYEASFTLVGAAGPPDINVRCAFGATNLLGANGLEVTSAADTWYVAVLIRIIRLTATTQIAYATVNARRINGGGAPEDISFAYITNPAENLAGAVTLKGTGQSSMAGASQIVQNSSHINARAV